MISQGFIAVIGALGLNLAGLGLRQTGVLLGVFQLDQHLAARHPLAIHEPDPLDELCCRRRERHGLSPLGHAQHLDGIFERLRRDNAHRNQWGTAEAASTSRAAASGTANTTARSTTLRHPRWAALGPRAGHLVQQFPTARDDHNQQQQQRSEQEKVPSDQNSGLHRPPKSQALTDIQ